MKLDRLFIISVLLGLSFSLMTFYERKLIDSLWVFFYWIYFLLIIFLVIYLIKSILKKRFRVTLILLFFAFASLIYNATTWEIFKSEVLFRAYSSGPLGGDLLVLREDGTYDVQSISFIGFSDEWSGEYKYDGENIVVLNRDDLEDFTPDTFKIIHSALVNYGDYLRNPDSLILIEFDITYDNLHDPNRLERLYWYAEYSIEHNYKYLVKGDLFNASKLSNQEIIDVLNKRKSESKLELVSLSSDTINVIISKDYILSEQMGSCGALCYMGESVFTLTEKEGVNFVNLIFEGGSHAVPGVYSREDFKQLIKRDL